MSQSSIAVSPLTPKDFYAHDWSATPLGKPEGWSDVLRLWVQFILVSGQPIAMVWGSQQIFIFNEAYCRMIGPQCREALGRSLPQLRADIWGRVKPIAKEVRAGRSGVIQNVQLQTWSRSPDELRYFSIAYSPVQTLEGDVAGALLMYTDTTDQLQRERVLRERDALKELFEQAPGFITMVEGPEHRYTLSNAANNTLLGRTDVVGRTVSEAFPELVEQGIITILDEVYASGTPFIAYGMPFKIRRGEGVASDTRYIDTIYQPIRDAKKQIIGIFAEGHDVTAHRLAQERLQALQTDLIHVSRASAMDAMASAMAHELNQPLTSISSYMAAARRMLPLDGTDSTLKQCIEGAGDAAQRAGKIIRMLRDLTAKREVKKVSLDLEVTIKDAIGLMTIGNPGMTVAYDLGTVTRVFADAVQIQQVVMNLVKNSLDASITGRTHIKIGARRMDGEVEVRLCDDGPGIPQDLLPSLFYSFTTTKEAGMGVGLSICRTIIEAHGGRIWAGNDTDGGAVVGFTIKEANRDEKP